MVSGDQCLGGESVKTRVIFDSDVIGDDILAIVSGAGIGDLDLCGVTTYGRRIGSRERAAIAAGVLDSVGRAAIPVAAGANAPLLRDARVGCIKCDQPIMKFRTMYPGCPATDDAFRERVDPRPAYRFICDTIQEHPGEITVVCTGPLTNLALALQDTPEITNMVRDVVIMGGAAWVGGNVTPVAESNIYADPEAAEIVFRKMRSVTMVGLDVTLQVRVVMDDMADALDGKEGPLWTMAHGIIRSCIEAQVERGRPASMPLHDPLALLVAVDPSLVETAECRVAVERCGEYTDGETVCYPVDVYHDSIPGALVRVAKSVDIDRATDAFLNSLRLQ